MKDINKENHIDWKSTKAKGAATLALGALMLFPNANFANEDTREDLSQTLWKEISHNPSSNLDLKNTLNFSSVNTIPPKLKSFYKKLWSIKSKDDLKTIEFTQREMWFLMSWQFMNPEWITKSSGRRASQKLIEVFWWLSKEDLKSFYEDYKSKNPNVKISKKEFNVLSQPIEANNFYIRALSGNREHRISPVFETAWYLLISPQGSLFVSKPKLEIDKNIWSVYEPWLIYSYGGRNKANATPLKISSDKDWNYFVENLNGARLNGWCAIWVDGHLYSIDDHGNVVRKDGKKYPIIKNKQTWEYSFDRSKFVSVWNYLIDGLKQDNTTWEPYLSFDMDQWFKDLHASLYRNKESSTIISFRQTELYSRWYRLLPNEANKTLILEKGEFRSPESKDIVDLSWDEIEEWLVSAKESIDKQMEQKLIKEQQYKRKESVFQDFVNNNCDVSFSPVLRHSPVYPLDLSNIKYSDLREFNSTYGIQKRESLNDGQSAYIVLVDMETGTLLNNWNQPMFFITDRAGLSLDLFHMPLTISMFIKRYENEKSARSFLDLVLKDGNGNPIDYTYNYVLNYWIEYNWFKLDFSGGMESKREYQIKISKKNSRDGAIVYVSPKMTAEDIKKEVDNSISKMK
jgi:hypothetical protein